MFSFRSQKPESPLWQISSTQSSVVASSSSVAPSTSSRGPISSTSSVSPPSVSAVTASVSQPHNIARDEIYIDDEGLEGSGGRGEVSSFLFYFLCLTFRVEHFNSI